MADRDSAERQAASNWYYKRFGVHETQVSPKPVNDGMTDLGPSSDGRPRILPESSTSMLPSVADY